MGELVGAVDVAQPGVSRHLRILSEGGMVTCRAVGQRRLYSLRPDPLRELQAWMRRFAHDERDRVGRLAAFLEDGGTPAAKAHKKRKE